MKMIFAFVSMLALAFAQVSTIDKTNIPASREDVQGIKSDIKRMRAEALVAEKKSATRNAQDHERMLRENKAEITATETKLAQGLESIEREARKSSDDQLRTQRIVWFVTGGVVLVSILFLAVVVFKKPSVKLIYPVATITRSPRLQKEYISEILLDPDIPALETFSIANGGQREIPFILSLKDGTRFNCIAELRGELDPLVHIEGDSTSIVWDKRRQRAAKISALKAS